MNCENNFCIYQQNNKCLFDEIELDITGICQSCIYVDIPIKELENYKSLQREKIDNY